MKIYIILVIIALIIGTYYYIKSKQNEGFEGPIDNSLRCPNMLIQKGARYYLYNSKIARVPGVNPIAFNNLEDYVEFLEWQHSVGIRCPVLYLQNTYDAQGNRVYKIRPSVTDLQGGLPSTNQMATTQMYNNQMNPNVPADQFEQSFPVDQSLPDQFEQSLQSYQPPNTNATYNEQNNLLYSPDAMKPNWGGKDYTDNAISSGAFKEDEVYKTGANVELISKKPPFSADAMVDSWGGSEYSDKAVASGAFKGNEVFLQVA